MQARISGLSFYLFSDIMSSLLGVGDCCFGRVKGYPWWPAKITEKISSTKRKKCFQVTFFGTKETAWLAIQDLQCITVESIQRFTSPAIMKRKHFATGLKEMMDESLLETEVKRSSVRNVLHEITNREGERNKCSVSSSVKIGTTRDTFKNCQESTLDKPDDHDDFETDIDPNTTDTALDFLQYFDLQRVQRVEAKGIDCEFCDDSFVNLGELQAHYSAKHGKEEQDGDDDEEGINFGNKKVEFKEIENDHGSVNLLKKPHKELSENGRGKSIKKVGKNVSKKKELKNKVQSLREQEVENDRKFMEFVETKDGGFSCNICGKFSSITKLLVRSHVVLCSSNRKSGAKIKRRRGQPPKKSKCVECGEEFQSKRDLNLHHRKEHVCEKYTCSTCLRQFSQRAAYVRHIKSHTSSNKLGCSVAGCGKTFRYNCDLKRHLATHSRSADIENKVRIITFFNIVSFSEYSTKILIAG